MIFYLSPQYDISHLQGRQSSQGIRIFSNIPGKGIQLNPHPGFYGILILKMYNHNNIAML
jgi:hypothetical protein